MLDKMTFTHDGRTYRCWVESVNVSSDGPAIPSNAMWMVEVDGVTRAAFEASPDDQESDVQQRIIEWDSEGRFREGS